ncbi:MAG TPA: rRNA maturation RNase YbeY [Terriglobales bacterium]|nr:rRNA maturation RNase YbeY [Terriglobales bacterium]
MIDADHCGRLIPKSELSHFLRLAQAQIGVRGEVNVRIASNEEIRRLNRQFRRKDKATDVLSFPVDPLVVGEKAIAGDIAISAEIAQSNAESLGHSFEAELKILILHGLLHLAGFDHEQDDGEMQARERLLREKLKLPVGLIERAHNGNHNGSGARRQS